MHKAFKACTAVLLALVMTVSLVNGALAAVVRNDDDTISYEPLEQGVYSKGGYTIDKVSHPTLGAGEVDGILTGDLQDRGQSYSWSMAEAGDYVYIGTCYNSTYYIYHNNVKTSLDAMKKEFGTTQRKMQELDNLAALRTQAEAKHMITTYGQHLPALAIMAKNNGESTAGRLGQMLREARSAAEQKFNVPFDRLPAQQQVEVNVAVLQLAEQGAREMAQALGVTLPTPKPAQQTQVQDDQGIRREGSTMFHVVDGQIQDNRGNVYVPDAAGRLIPTRIPGVAAPGSTMSPDSGRPRNAPMSRQDLRQGIRATLEARNVNNIQ